MPEISRFLGIVIRMYYLDHEPPHFHATYSGTEAQIGVDPVVLLRGTLPARVLALVVEWAMLHQNELRGNWHRLRDDQPPLRIAPLE